MAEDRIRPTWNLGDEVHPATFPAAQLDPDEATRAALAINCGSERMTDVTALTEAAISYAAETMRDAIAELAFRVMEQPVGSPMANAAGWIAHFELGASKSAKSTAINMTFTHPVNPGAWLVSVHFDKVMTDRAKAVRDALQEKINEEHKAKGLSPRDSVMERLFPKGERSETQSRHDILVARGDSYRPARRGDTLQSVTSTALELGKNGLHGAYGVPGPLEGVESCENADSYLPTRTYRDIWWHAMELNMGPSSRHQRDEAMLTPRTGRSGASPHLSLEIISDFVVSQGLLDLVRPLDEATSTTSWISFGDRAHTVITEAGHSYVHAAGGVFDGSVVARIRDFSANIAAQDVSTYLDEWIDMAPRMAARGYDNEKNRYECNDGRSIAYATVDGNVSTLHLETQHGQYETRIETGEDGKTVRVDAFRTTGSRIPVGRFAMVGDRLVPEYGAKDGAEAIPYNIRHVRDMNGIILSLSSVSCVFEEEFGKADQPAP